MGKLQFQTQDIARFSRRWWLSAGRNFLWVAIVTLLIWVYADMEVAGTERVMLTVRLTTGNSQELMLLSDSDHRVGFAVRGPRGALERFVNKYNNSVLSFDVSKSYKLGSQAIPTADILNEQLKPLELGLEIRSASPPAISGVHLDRRRHESVRVQFVYTNAELEEPPKERKVRISLAESQWQEIRGKQPDPALRTVEKNLQTEQTGVPITVKADIIPVLEGLEVTLEEKSIEFTIVIKQLTGTKSILIAVTVLAPPAWVEDGTWKEYVLERQEPADWRKEIDVTGPRTDLERLNPADVHAYIVLTDEDKKPVGSWLTRPVLVDFPKGLNVTAAEKLTVGFRLKRAAPTTPP